MVCNFSQLRESVFFWRTASTISVHPERSGVKPDRATVRNSSQLRESVFFWPTAYPISVRPERSGAEPEPQA